MGNSGYRVHEGGTIEPPLLRGETVGLQRNLELLQADAAFCEDALQHMHALGQHIAHSVVSARDRLTAAHASLQVMSHV